MRFALTAASAAICLACLASIACQSGADVARQDISVARERGIVIDGMCPAQVEPIRYGQYGRREPEQQILLYGTAHRDRIELAWTDQLTSGVDSFVIIRLGPEFGESGVGGVQTYFIDRVNGTSRFIDYADLEPKTRYSYRLFPVTAGEIGYPSTELHIWSLPIEVPRAPIRAWSDYHARAWSVSAYYGHREFVSGFRVLRKSPDSPVWQELHSETVAPTNTFGHDRKFWRDEEIDPQEDYEYAICFSNPSGFGRATVIDASRESRFRATPEAVRATNASATLDRQPLSIRNLNAMQTKVGVVLTWESPNDPAVDGILIEELVVDHDISWYHNSPSILPPGATGHLALNPGYAMGRYLYCYRVNTINDYGTPVEGMRRTCVDASDDYECRTGVNGVRGSGAWRHPVVNFEACEENNTKVVRHQLTADGFVSEQLVQPCAWEESTWQRRGRHSYPGTLLCQFKDTGLEQGHWYVFELSQTFEDGEVWSTFHEFMALPAVESP